jgi:hypothetical protein
MRDLTRPGAPAMNSADETTARDRHRDAGFRELQVTIEP